MLLPESVSAESAGASPQRVGSGQPFGEILGLQVKFYQGQPQRDLALLRDLGVRWVREEAHWGHVEKKPGVFEFPESLGERLDFYRKNGIGVIFILAYSNENAYPASADNPHHPANPEAFARYAVEVAKLLRHHGVEFVLEIWNEPHNSLRPLIGGLWNGHPPSPWVDHYIGLVKATVKAVKALDPTIRLLTDDDMWVIHYWFLEAGLPKEIDGFAFHPYNGKRTPEMAAVDKFTDWLGPFDVVDDDRSFRSAVRRLREQGRRKLGKNPAMWVTEWGWPTGNDENQLTEALVAAYLPRAYITAAAAGVEAMCWFSAQDAVDGPMGLTENSGRRRMAYHAFRNMSIQLRDKVLESHLIGIDHQTSGIQAYLFRGDASSTIVAWNIDGEPATLSIRNVGGSVEVRDVVGKVTSPGRDGNGNVTVRLTEAPVYISGIPSSADVDELLTLIRR